jgi:3-phenylpropionate/cinnamic acid dioxygenase small subunit
MTTTADIQAKLDRLLLQHEVEQFLYHEQSLLDDRKWAEWLDLLTEDVRYFMPLARNIKMGEEDHEYTRELQDASWMDEGKELLRRRVMQLQTGVHWAEEPLSRTAHIITNLQITEVNGDEVHTRCNFVTYRNRIETQTDLFVGRRKDMLRKVNGEWKLARREIYLAQNVLLAMNLTILF